MRFDIYGLIHKAQRKYLFDLSSLLARSDAEDADQCQLIEKKVRFIAKHLKEHSETEETYIHPLFQEVSAMQRELDHEHEDFEPALDALIELAQEKDLAALYHKLNIFIANYLLHQAKEERAQEEILWPHFDDRRLAAVMGEFLAAKSRLAIVKDLEFMMPAMNIHEAMRVFSVSKPAANESSSL